MAKIVLTDTKIYAGAYDISGILNATSIDYSADTPECTTFGDDTHVMASGGLKNVTVAHEGYWDTVLDSQLFSDIGVADVPIIIAPEGVGTVGNIAYFMRATESQYTIGGSIGEVLPVSIQAVCSSSPLIRGYNLLNGTIASSSGTSTGVQAGAASSSQTIYACLVVYTAGSSGTFTIESDDNSGFTTATTRFTFTQGGGTVGYEFMTLAGPITDTYWRVNYSVGGTVGFGVVLGIL